MRSVQICISWRVTLHGRHGVAASAHTVGLGIAATCAQVTGSSHLILFLRRDDGEPYACGRAAHDDARGESHRRWSNMTT